MSCMPIIDSAWNLTRHLWIELDKLNSAAQLFHNTLHQAEIKWIFSHRTPFSIRMDFNFHPRKNKLQCCSCMQKILCGFPLDLKMINRHFKTLTWGWAGMAEFFVPQYSHQNNVEQSVVSIEGGGLNISPQKLMLQMLRRTFSIKIFFWSSKPLMSVCLCLWAYISDPQFTSGTIRFKLTTMLHLRGHIISTFHITILLNLQPVKLSEAIKIYFIFFPVHVRHTETHKAITLRI